MRHQPLILTKVTPEQIAADIRAARKRIRDNDEASRP